MPSFVAAPSRSSSPVVLPPRKLPRTALWGHWQYDFARQGGAQGTITLLGSDVLPAGALIIGGILRTTQDAASGGLATVALSVNNPGDLFVAKAFDDWMVAAFPITMIRASLGSEFGTTGPILADATGTNSVLLLSASGVPLLTIAVADLTGGAFDLWCEYLPTA